MICIGDRGRALHLDLSKFLRCQLSTRVTDRPKEDRYIFSGVHSQEKFQSYIYDYIDRFVRCTVCGNPETTLVRKQGKLFSREEIHS